MRASSGGAVPTHSELLAYIAQTDLPPQVKVLGLTRHNQQAALLVLLDSSGAPTAFSASEAASLTASLSGVPLGMREVPGALHAATYLPRAQVDALTPEQGVLKPVVLGAQLQNGSADVRAGGVGVGTLGVFARAAQNPVQIPDQRDQGQTLLLSNNHVIAAENDAEIGDDIYQAQRGRGRVVAQLSAWVPISFDAPNRVDIACAELLAGAPFENAFLPLRNRPSPAGVVAPRVGLRVFKVGRTSGLTFGSITAVAARVPRVEYGVGGAAFEGSFSSSKGREEAPSAPLGTAAAGSSTAAGVSWGFSMRATAPSR